MIGKLRVRLTAGVRVTLKGRPPGRVDAPRWTVTPLVNSATYQIMVTAVAVPTLWKVRVVEFVIWPVTWPSTGSTVFSLTPKTRNDLVVSTAVGRIAVALALP